MGARDVRSCPRTFSAKVCFCFDTRSLLALDVSSCPRAYSAAFNPMQYPFALSGWHRNTARHDAQEEELMAC